MRDATWTGAARVWRSSLSDQARLEKPANLASYLICAPGAHPLWSWHILAVIHLRDVEGQEAPPTVQFPGATHEFMVLALHPDHDHALDPDDSRTWVHLLPPDAVVQTILPSDQAAVALCEQLAVTVAHGSLVPDSDYRRSWEAIIQRTAEHVRTGGHPDG